jgi:uncharacterized protein with FMN-binding domain
MTRIPNNLLALGSAAVLTIYGAGFQRTRAAADKFAEEADAHTRPLPQLRAAPEERDAATESARAPETAVSGPPSTERLTDARPSTPATSAPASSPARLESPTTTALASNAPATPIEIASSAPSVAALTPAAPVAPAAPAPASPASAAAPIVSPSEKGEKHEAEKAKTQWRDGSYTGWGTSRHGDIEATVVIADGRITSATISRCLTRYSCSWINHLQQQVVVRQSADVDFVSGATQSTNAFYYAVLEALKKAL